jgi:hypothetical protein
METALADTGPNADPAGESDPDVEPQAGVEAIPGAALRSQDACPDDLPEACDRIWSYMERLGVEPCERGQITLDLLDRAMETTLAEGGHLTPAAMDALTAWLVKREAALADAPPPCDDVALIGQLAHPPVQRQCMAPERRSGPGAWRRAPQVARPSAPHPALPNPSPKFKP